MKTTRWHMLATLGLGLTGLAGCQTWVPTAGLTLPSGHYLEHRPQYFPTSPSFSLPRELATMELQQAQGQPGAALPVPLPPPAPPPGGGG